MRKSSPVVMDSLESRRLLSGSHFDGPEHEGHDHHDGGLFIPVLPVPAGPVTTAAFTKVSADKVKVLADKTTLQTDNQTLEAALKAAKVTLATPLAALHATAEADELANEAILKVDFTAIQTVYQKDGPAISADLKAISADLKAKNTVQLAIDQAKLVVDKATLATDLTVPKAKLSADFAAADATEQADEKAIKDLLNTDAAVAAARLKLTSDQAVYTTDFNAFVADRTTYVLDLKTPLV